MNFALATMLVIAVALLSVTKPAIADTPKRNLSHSGIEAYALPEIVVTAKDLRGSLNSERKVGVENIQAWNAHTVAEVLVQTPGVNVQYGGSSGDAMYSESPKALPAGGNAMRDARPVSRAVSCGSSRIDSTTNPRATE